MAYPGIPRREGIEQKIVEKEEKNLRFLMKSHRFQEIWRNLWLNEVKFEILGRQITHKLLGVYDGNAREAANA